jgi:hypothetical protein
MFPAMEVEGVRAAVPTPRTPQPIGVTAALADARAKLREAAPPDRWNAVMNEVTRVQVDQSTSVLQAMQIVLRRLAGGWTPPTRD